MVNKPTIVYDGTCGVCSRSMRIIKSLDWMKVFDFIPSQDTARLTDTALPPPEKREQQIHLVLPDGKVFGGGDALRHIGLRLPLTFVPAIISCIPPFPALLRKFYPVLARNRYRLGGKCEYVPPDPQ